MKNTLLIFIVLFAQNVFAGDILTTKGYVADAKIQVGDTVISFDLNGSGVIKNIVTEKRLMTPVWYAEQKETSNYYLINGKYKFFCDQSIYDGQRVIHVSELHIGDTIYNYTIPIRINRISLVGSESWYRFEISGDHSYILDGILVHNAARFFVLQNASHNLNATVPTNWSGTSGTAGNASVPGSSDDVTFDGAGAGNNTAIMSSTFTWLTLTFTSGYTSTITINNNQSVTIAGNFTDRPEHTWNIVTPAQNNLGISAAATITSNGETYPGSVLLSNTSTKTLSGDWTISGTLTFGAGLPVLNSGTLNCAGLIMTVAGSGTTIIRLTGGTWSGVAGLTNSVTFAGNVTLTNANALTWGTGTMTYESGTVTTTGNSLNITTSATMNTAGITFNNVNITAAITLTINSLLSISGTFTNSGSITYAGTAGWTTGIWSITTTTAATITLKNGVTYTVTAAFSAFTSRTGAIILITSDNATVQAILTLNNGGTCSVLADATRIDSSNGRTINSFHGTLTTTTNWFSYTDYNGGLSSYLFCQ